MKHDVSNKISETVADYSVSHRQIARAAGVSHSTVSRASKAGYMVTKPVRDAIDYGCNKLSMYTPTAVIAANLEKQVEQLRDTVEQTQLAPINFSDDQKTALKKPLNITYQTKEFTPNENAGLDVGVDLWNSSGAVKLQPDPFMTSGLVDDAIESAHSREKAELQKALADLAKANKRLACQSENIDTLQQQLAAERVANNDTIERLQSDLDAIHHEYTMAENAFINGGKRLTQIIQDKVSLSHERDRLQSRAEVLKITAFTAGMLFLVTLFCLIVILVG